MKRNMYASQTNFCLDLQPAYGGRIEFWISFVRMFLYWNLFPLANLNFKLDCIQKSWNVCGILCQFCQSRSFYSTDMSQATFQCLKVVCPETIYII